MSASVIALLLKQLAAAYPEKVITDATLKLYLQELSDIPNSLLDQVVSQHIQSSPWFPHVSDLRLAAQKLAGTADFSNLPPPGVDILTQQAFQLEQRYFSELVFDPLEWEKLASQLDKVGRIYRAQELRLKAQHIQEAEAAFKRGEPYPAQEVCERYAEWVKPR
jgi:hypothetical protein